MFGKDQPVNNYAGIAGLLVVFINAFVLFLSQTGTLQWDDSTQTAFQALVIAAVNLGVVLFTMRLGAQPKVTPVSNPKVEDPVTGELVPLVRIDNLPLPGEK